MDAPKSNVVYQVKGPFSKKFPCNAKDGPLPACVVQTASVGTIDRRDDEAEAEIGIIVSLQLGLDHAAIVGRGEHMDGLSRGQRGASPSPSRSRPPTLP